MDGRTVAFLALLVVVALGLWWARRAMRSSAEARQAPEAQAAVDPIERFSVEGRPDRFEVSLADGDADLPAWWIYEFPAAVVTSYEPPAMRPTFEQLEWDDLERRFQYRLRRLEGPRWQRVLDAEPFERYRDGFLARVTSGVAEPAERALREFYVTRWAASLEWRDVPEAHQGLVEACYQRWLGSGGGGEARSEVPQRSG